MAKHVAKGPFTVKLTTESVHARVDGQLGRRSIDKVFDGDLVGHSAGEMLSAMGHVQGSAGYVAIERVEGALHGRKGSFCLQHYGMMNRGEPSLVIDVVPDSGTDDLAGLSGKLKIHIAPGGAHSYEFEYELGA